MEDLLSSIYTFYGDRMLLAEGKAHDWSLAKYHIPNLNREEDRTTKLLLERYLAHKDNPDLVFYIILSRLINNWPALKEIDYGQPFTTEFIQTYGAYLDFCMEGSNNPYSITSYTYYIYKNGGQRFYNDIFKPMLAGISYYRTQLAFGQPKDVFKLLGAFRGIGRIMGVEIVKDLLLIRDTPTVWNVSWNSFYSVATLNALRKRKQQTYIPRDMYDEELSRMAIEIDREFKVDLPIDNYYFLARFAHIYGRTVLADSAVLHPYIPKRALSINIPSWSTFQRSYVNTN